jgi:hypothetical protein
VGISRVMRAGGALAAGLVAAFLAFAGPAAAQSHDCFWSLPPKGDVNNGLSQDQNARYWLGEYALPPGASLAIHGRFPHGRFMSFTAYNSRFAIAGFLLDTQIAPDPGAVNPFVAGASRRAGERGYGVRLVPGAVPEQPEPNTLYASDEGRPLLSGYLIYRHYLPDRGTDATGDVGLPRVSVELPGGQTVAGSDACRYFESVPSGVPHQIPPDAGGPTAPAGYPGSDPPRWHVFKNLMGAVDARYTPGTPAEAIPLPESDASYLTSPGQAYIFTETNRAFGPVLAITLRRAPGTPRTRAGQRRFGDGELRYWSLCQTDPATTTYIACLADERVRRTRRGGARFVISLPEDRPHNARRRCGVNWLPWGPSQHGEILVRNMLPDPGFAHPIQAVPEGGDIAAVMGDYFPRPRYLSTAEFEGRGCRRG